MKQKKSLFMFFALFTILTSSYDTTAQVLSQRISSTKFPQILSNEVSKISFVNVKPIDLEVAKAEDVSDEKTGLPPRLGRSKTVNIGLESGNWTNTNSGKLWQVGITSKEAKGFMLVFDELVLPEGAELYIFNSRKTMLIGAITHLQNSKSGRFSCDVVKGDSIVITLIESPSAFGKTKLHLESVLYVYSLPFYADFVDAPSDILECHIDVVCPQGNNWVAQSNAVAMIVDAVTGRRCTGTLLNNACSNLRPTFYTAFHCPDFNRDRSLNSNEISRIQNWVFRFGYKSASCGGGDNPSWQSISGASISAESENTDGLLLQLSSKPNAQSGITYAGWTTNVAGTTVTTALHHPGGHPMKISIDNQVPDFQNSIAIDNYTITNGISPTWDVGGIQGGSSGCAYFDQNQRVVAQHSGSLRKCDDRRAFAGTIAQAFANGFNNVLRDDPSVTATNTIAIPSMSIPADLCANTPLTLSNLPVNMGFTGGSITGANITGWFSGIAPQSGYNGEGHLEFQFKPNGITCNDPLIVRKDFWVGPPLTPQISFTPFVECYGFTIC